jgi:Polyketide cyclase / dehydrase and lipid transport
MSDRNTLQLEHSVEAEVSPVFAWRFRTDVTKWNDPPAVFALDGDFREGACGTTQLPGQPTLHWRIRDVNPGISFTTEMQLEGATLSFRWSFGALAKHRTKLTQRIMLSGGNAAAYAAQVEAGFGATLADGMRRIAAEMESAEREANRG